MAPKKYESLKKKSNLPDKQEERKKALAETERRNELSNRQAELQGQTYNIGGKNVSRSEYAKQKNELGTSKDPEIIKQKLQPAEIESILKERREGREEPVVETPIIEQPLETPQAEVPVEQDQNQVFNSLEEGSAAFPEGGFQYLDENGEVKTQFGGSINPVTPSDLTDVALLFMSFGLGTAAKVVGTTAVKKGGMLGFKKVVAKVGKGTATKVEQEVAKKGILKIISSKIGSKIGLLATGLAIGAITSTASQLISGVTSKRVTAADRSIRSLDTGLSQVRETITAPVQLVNAGLPIEEGLEMLDDLRNTVNGIESLIKDKELKSQEMKTNPEFTLPMKLRINKLNAFLDLSERMIITAQVKGTGISEEDLMTLMITYEDWLKE